MFVNCLVKLPLAGWNVCLMLQLRDTVSHEFYVTICNLVCTNMHEACSCGFYPNHYSQARTVTSFAVGKVCVWCRLIHTEDHLSVLVPVDPSSGRCLWPEP